MSIVELRFEAHRCFREAIRCDDPERAAKLTAEGYRLSKQADDAEARRSCLAPREADATYS